MIRRLGARYELQEPIGGGGMAVVYRAVDTLLDRTVAVKMLRPQYAGDEEFVARFRQEAQSAARLSHPNIVNLYDIGVSNNEYYLVMEYVEGPTLKDVIRTRAPLEIEDVVDISSQICDALEHAHNRQIIHRDVKPHNILLTNSGQVKVTDFGIARAITGNTITYQQATSVLGSVHYFSPEQARGAAADVKSDIYSLGVVMYEMLTKELPFSGDTPVSVALKHLREQFVEPRDLYPEIPQSLENIVLRCLVKSPENRYPNMKSVKSDLNQALLRPEVPKLEFPTDEVADATIAMPAVGGPVGLGGSATPAGDTSPAEELGDVPKKRGRFVRILLGTLISICVLVAAAVAAYFIEFHFIQRVHTLQVPNLTGITEAQAMQTLTKDGFLIHNVKIKRTYNNQPAGMVFNQQPKAPMMVMETREIDLYVSKGPARVQMMDLQNMPLEQAIQELKNQGITHITTDHMYSDNIDKNNVVYTQPGAGSQVTVNQPIVITVSDGPRPMVPMVGGLTLSQAKQLLLDANLQIGKVFYEPAPGAQQGTVVNSDPAPMQQVAPGAVVNLYVADNGGNPGGTSGSSDNGSTTGLPSQGAGSGTASQGTNAGTTDGTTTNGSQGTSLPGNTTGSTAGSPPQNGTPGAQGTNNSQPVSDASGGGQTTQGGSATGSQTSGSGLSMVPVQVTVTDKGHQALAVVIKVKDATVLTPKTYLSSTIGASASWTVPVYVSATEGGEVFVYVNGKLLNHYPIASQP